jgi:hypothetical protein
MRNSWDKLYLIAREYYLNKGDLLVPARFVTQEGYNLGTWVGYQRQWYKNLDTEKLMSCDKERIEQLQLIGIDFNPINTKWQIKFRSARKYYENNSTLVCPNGYCMDDGFNLYSWLEEQRFLKASEKLSKERITALESIGVIWEMYSHKWDEWFDLAKRYFEKYNNLSIPYEGIFEGRNIGAWIANMRSRKEVPKKGRKLTSRQVSLLNSLEIEWDVSNKTWSTSFPEQAIYHYIKRNFPTAINRHSKFQYELDVYIPELRLGIEYDGRWHIDKKDLDIKKNIYFTENNILLIRVRESMLPTLDGQNHVIVVKPHDYSELTLAINQILKIISYEVMGVIVNRDIDVIRDYAEIIQYKNSINYNWMKMYGRANKYYLEKGDLLVPKRSSDLGSWISRQRRAYQGYDKMGRSTGHLSKEQIEMLESIGMTWDVKEDKRNEMYQEVEKYYSKFGNLRVNIHYKTENGNSLGRWINWQKIKNKRYDGITSKEQNFLNSKGICWDSLEREWEEMYQKAKEFYNRHQHLLVSTLGTDNGEKRLAQWIGTQRHNYKVNNNVLTLERKEFLEKIGMEWCPIETTWEKWFELAEKYFVQNNHLNISQSYIAENGQKLGLWIGTQRQKKKNFNRKNKKLGTLSEKKVDRLNRVGMIW